jgi:hypothetical protein
MTPSPAFTHRNSHALIVQLGELADSQQLSEARKKGMINWVLRFLRFNQGCNPALMGKAEVEAFLSYLAQTLNFESSSQRNASSALLFLYQDYFKIKLGQLHYTKLKPRRGFGNRFSEVDCRAVLKNMTGPSLLMANLAISANLKLKEIINLRLGDLDFKKNQIIIRSAKGDTKFIANIPVHLILDLRIQNIKVHSLIKRQKELDLAEDYNELKVLEKRLEPEWQFLFPQQNPSLKMNQPQTQPRNQAKPLGSLLNQTPLSVLKNDIRIATKRHLRFTPNNKPNNTSLKFPKTLHTPARQQAQYLTSSYSNNKRQQTAFCFIQEQRAT